MRPGPSSPKESAEPSEEQEASQAGTEKQGKHLGGIRRGIGNAAELGRAAADADEPGRLDLRTATSTLLSLDLLASSSEAVPHASDRNHGHAVAFDRLSVDGLDPRPTDHASEPLDEPDVPVLRRGGD